MGAVRASYIKSALAAAIGASILIILLAGSAFASQLVARDVSHARLEVNQAGVALVTYRTTDGRDHRVLYWGAINAAKRFRYDRSGGWRSRKADWRHFSNVCGAYTGPRLVYVVAACTMPDGSHWALQSWRREVKNYGGVAGPVDLRVSHFRGDLAYLWIRTDWSWNGRFRHMYGQFVYQGKPVVAVAFRPNGYVLDGIGRNIAIDSWNSDYGRGWRRVNAFLSHKPNGQFCFGFSPKIQGDPRTGRSSEEWYRATVAGPGVSPDVMTSFRGQLGAYDRQVDAQHNYWQGVLSGWASSGPCSRKN